MGWVVDVAGCSVFGKTQTVEKEEKRAEKRGEVGKRERKVANETRGSRLGDRSAS
jgi:hypothetical protein